jgi:hypothetical protein
MASRSHNDFASDRALVKTYWTVTRTLRRRRHKHAAALAAILDGAMLTDDTATLDAAHFLWARFGIDAMCCDSVVDLLALRRAEHTSGRVAYDIDRAAHAREQAAAFIAQHDPDERAETQWALGYTAAERKRLEARFVTGWRGAIFSPDDDDPIAEWSE